ncbi:MAG: MerR family transcriptional regulator [Ahrensia sp.]|nr:MerR family transcriptional regulator [Ahrensia sp.]
MTKSPDALRTISEVAESLDLPQHVLRFWETRFRQIKPMKRGGGRRYYRPEDVELLTGIRHLLYSEGYTIKGVQRILKEQGNRFVAAAGKGGLALAIEEAVPAKQAVPVQQLTSQTISRAAGNSRANLNSALAELLECKRLLDQVR